MTREEQKTALGERLFQKIVEVTPLHAPKITGMLLEIDFAEALSLLENEQKLNAKVEEALCVLREHEGKQRQHH
jgi:polyadenylate-binding protein